MTKNTPAAECYLGGFRFSKALIISPALPRLVEGVGVDVADGEDEAGEPDGERIVVSTLDPRKESAADMKDSSTEESIAAAVREVLVAARLSDARRRDVAASSRSCCSRSCAGCC